MKKSTKAVGGYINHPITISGVLVNPGDLIFADNDSVVCVPRQMAEEVYRRTKQREDEEDARREVAKRMVRLPSRHLRRYLRSCI